MSRSGKSGNSPGICSCCSTSFGSRASSTSSSVLLGMSVLFLGLFVWLAFGDWNLEFRTAPFLYLWQPNYQQAVCQFGRRIFHANRPAQRHHALKIPIGALGTQVRHYALTRLPFLLLSADAQLAAAQSYLDLGGANARQFDANVNRFGSLAKVDGRRPRAGHRWQLRLGCFLQDREKPPDPFGQSLKLDSLESRRAYASSHESRSSMPSRNLPATRGHEGPNTFDQSKGPRALKKSISRRQCAGPGKRENEPRAAIFQCIANQHRRN